MGHKCELFVNEVDKNLICPICHEVFQDPVSCKSGHTFCDECIKKWLRQSDRCPMDNVVIYGASSLSSNINLKGIIDNLDVRCNPSVPKGEPRCVWRGRFENLNSHRKNCPFQEEQCRNGDCGQQIQKREMEEHDKICPHKRVKCEDCLDVVMRQDLEKHKEDECEEALIPCPNICTNAKGEVTKVKRRDQDNHVENTCGKTEVGCPFQKQGCSACVTREDVHKHLEGNATEHMMLLATQNARFVESLKVQNERLAQQNAQLKDDLKKLKDDLSSYVWKIHDYPSQFKRLSSGSYFRSPYFWLCGYSWYLRVFPKGDNSDAQGLMTFNLCMNTEGSSRQLRPPPVIFSSEVDVSYTLSLVSQTSCTDDIAIRGSAVFGKNQPFHKESLTIDEKDLTLFCKNENLTIKCTIHVCV